MTISLRLNDQDTALFKKYASLKGLTVSEMIRQAVLAQLEDEYDLHIYEQAMANFKKQPTTYTLAEVEKELGLK